MGLITGYLSFVLLLLLLFKYVARVMKLTKITKFFNKTHKYIAYGFLLLSIIHFLLVLKVLEGRSVLVTVSGIVILAVGLLLTVVCHCIRNKKVEIVFHRIFSLVMFFMLVAHIITYFSDFQDYKDRISQIEIHEVDLDVVEDGSYVGEYDAGYVYAKVNVTVHNHIIERVEILKHVTERGKPAEIITENMVKEQRIDVDSVSHATNSSNVIKMAVINALKGNE